MHEGEKNAKFMASQRALPGLIQQFSMLCIITMRKLMLLYVSYHISGFLRKKKKKRRKKNVFTFFLFFVSD